MIEGAPVIGKDPRFVTSQVTDFILFLCRCAESNRRPIDYESIALPTELQRR